MLLNNNFNKIIEIPSKVAEMADDEETDLPSVALGTSWDTFFAQCDSRTREKSESPVKQNSNDFVSRMPYQSDFCLRKQFNFHFNL